MTSRNQSLSSNDQGRQRRETLGTRLALTEADMTLAILKGLVANYGKLGYQLWHRPLKMASLVYEREIGVADHTLTKHKIKASPRMPRHIRELFGCAGAKIQNRLEKIANNNKEYGQKVDGYHMEKLVPDVRKGPANFRWFTTPTSIIKMRFS